MTGSTTVGAGTSKHAGIVSPYRHDDIIQPLTARNLDSTSGRLDYDYDRHCINIADSTLTSRNIDKIYWEYQIGHKFKLDGTFTFHLHWLQSSTDVPNWWMRWRIHQNFGVAGAWTEAKPAIDEAHPYAGETDFLQVAVFPIIDFSSEITGGLNVSDFLDIELTRDSNNNSGLFTGDDPLSGNASLKGADPHLLIDSAGSREAWAK